MKCHGEDEQESDVSLHNLDPAKLGGDDLELWSKVVEVLKFGKMPPEDETQPSKEDVKRITSWVQAELAAAGHASDVDHKLKQPAYANLLNHEKLFDGSIKDPSFSPPRLWRIHPHAYETFLQGFGRELGMGGPLSKPFTVGDGKRAGQQLRGVNAGRFSDALAIDAQLPADRTTLQTVGFKRMEKDRRTQEMVERHYRKPP